MVWLSNQTFQCVGCVFDHKWLHDIRRSVQFFKLLQIFQKKKKKRSRTYLFVYFFPNLGPQELMHMSNRNGCMCYVWGFCICAHEHVFTLHYSFCPSRRSFSLRPCPARLLSPQPSVNSAGNRAKPTTWEWTLLRTSRKSLLLSLNKEEGVGDRHCNRVLYSFGVMVLKRE